MALSRSTVWVTGQVLTATDLNNEFDNILNNPVPLISPVSTTIDFNLNQAQKFVIEKGAVNPATTSAGRLFYNTGSNTLYADNGTTLDRIGPGTNTAAGSRVKGLIGSVAANVATFTADEIVLRTTGNLKDASYPVTCTSGFSVNSQTVGTVAGGRDTAGVFASTYVYWYAISTGANSTACQGIVSTVPPNAGGPTLPTSYSAYAFLAGSAYTSSSSAAARNFLQRGSWSYFSSPTNLVSSGTATTEATIALKSFVPPEVLTFSVAHRGTGGGADASGNIQVSHTIRAIAGTIFHQADTIMALNSTSLGSAGIHIINETVNVPNLNAIPTIYYMSSFFAGSAPSVTLDILGWQNPNGDV